MLRIQRRIRALSLGVSFLLMACSTGRQNVPRQYGQSMDSATTSCRGSPALCTPGVGEKIPVVPPARPPGPPVLVTVGGTVAAASKSLDPLLLERIQRELEQCADNARSEVMLKHFKMRGPTREECLEVVGYDRHNKPITRAMELGVEQHEEALKCAEKVLDRLKPGGYSISPRYRYDPRTRKAEHIPTEVVKDLLSRGRGKELRGTLAPDIVIHMGSPLQVQAVFDYKFPCENTDRRSRWRRYPEGHPSGLDHQGTLYQEALKVEPLIVQPRIRAFK